MTDVRVILGHPFPYNGSKPKKGEQDMKSCSNDLRNKEVVNVCDGARLGFIVDVIFDVCDGKISAIVVPGEACGVLGLSHREDITIPWSSIEKIGEDIILVRVEHSGENCCPTPPPKKKGLFF